MLNNSQTKQEVIEREDLRTKTGSPNFRLPVLFVRRLQLFSKLSILYEVGYLV